MSFTQKRINPTGSLGIDVRELRERSGRSRLQVSQETKIAESVIRVWEDGSWSELEDPLYFERLFRLYIEYLGGNTGYFLEKYREEMKKLNASRSPDVFLPRTRKVHWSDLTVTSQIFAAIGFFVFMGALLLYIVLQVRAITVAPPLAITTPVDGARLEEPFVRVEGKTIPESRIWVNQQEVVVQPDGSFFIRLNVSRGTTLVQIVARRRYGDERTETRRVVYDRPLPDVRPLNSSSSFSSESWR